MVKKSVKNKNSVESKRSMKIKGKKSVHKKGVYREIEFPLSKKFMWVPVSIATNKNSVIAKAHLKGRKWEPKIAKILCQHAKKGSVAVDAGAYIGTHTLALVDAVGETGQVITFEPQTWAYHGIKKTLAKNKIKNVKLVNAGLSDKKGILRFCSDGTGSSSLCQERRPSPRWTEVYDIPIKTLDSFKLNNISIIKIDVEGHELNVLKGAEKTINRCKPVLVLEVWGRRTDRLQKMKAYLNSINYTIENISADDFICFPK
jgi:FkbM family methyltransferase